MRNIWTSNVYSIKTKLKIFNSSVVSVLLYGAECWCINKQDGERLDAFQRKCLRTILKVFWPRRISNEQLQEQIPHKSITSRIKEKRWRWIVLVLRMKNSEDASVAMNWQPPGKRIKGRPKNTWRRMVETERRAFGWSSWAEARRVAESRELWRGMTSAPSDSRSNGNT